MSQMLKSSGAMGAATLTSRVLGMVREMAYAGFMGVGWVADAFFMAFMVPNLFRRLLGEGALTAAFIPIFKEKEKLAGEKEMWRASNAVVSGLLAGSALLILLGLAGVSVAIAYGRQELNGATSFTGETLLMLQLLRVMLPYLLLVCLAAICMGMLNARGHFFVPAMGSTMLNLVMIASVWWLAPQFGANLEQQVFALAIGVVVAGLAQAAFQMPLLHREGFRYQWVTPWSDPTVRRVAIQMVPALLGVAAFQINVLVTQSMAFWFEKGIVSSFNTAVRLMELPQGVFGISLATYLLPTLSGLAAEKKFPEFRATLAQGLGYLVFINLLASVLLLVEAEPIVRLLFERGKFDASATLRASAALACLAPGLVAFSMVNILARAFYALGDTKTPMLISVFCLMINVLFAAALIWRFKQGGLGAANTLSAVCNVALLLFALRKKLARLELASLRASLRSLLIAGALAGGTAWGALWFWETRLGHDTLPMKIGEVFAPMTLATLVYFGVAHWLKISYAHEFTALLGKRLSRLRR